MIKKKILNFLFILEPLDTLVIKKDTSFMFMLEAQKRGHAVYCAFDGDLFLNHHQLFVQAAAVGVKKSETQPFVQQPVTTLAEEDIDIIFIRWDPPFDERYLINTWILDQAASRIPMINHPKGIRCVNEKIWTSQFREIIPPTFIGCQKEAVYAFLDQYKEIVIKPTNGFGGQSVFQVRRSDSNCNVILETMTAAWHRDVVLQKYVPESTEGDKRILLLNGEPLGAVLRLHSASDPRNNFYSGGRPVKAQINERDRVIMHELKPKLNELGLYFVGLDIMGGYLIEVNVTSPTCLQEINALNKVHLETQVIDLAEKLIDQKRSLHRI